MKFKILKQYISLYFKSIKLVFSSTKIWSLIIFCILPIQSIIPAIQILTMNEIINNISKSENIWGYIILWAFLFLLNNLLIPLNTMVQGQLTDKLTLKINKSLIEKSSELQSINYFENSKFYDDLTIIKEQSSWRPVNLLVFGTSLISNTISLVSMLFLLSKFSILISLIIFLSIIPQAIISYKIQQQAFETIVSNTQESRKLDYLSNLTLSHEYIKEIRLFNAYNYFCKKYEDIFSRIISSVYKNRIKNFIFSSIFLTIGAVISVSSFVYVVDGIRNSMFEVGAIVIFFNAIVYSLTNMSRIVEESS